MLVSCSQLAIHFDEEVRKKKQIRSAMDNKMLTIIIWDVQHGNAIYIRTPNNTNIVHDLGSGSFHNKKSDFSPLLHLRNQYNVSRLEYVIITHPHKDHIGDIFNFDGFHPIGLCRPRHLSEDEIRQGNKPEDNKHLDKYIEINKPTHMNLIRMRSIGYLRITVGLKFNLLYLSLVTHQILIIIALLPL